MPYKNKLKTRVNEFYKDGTVQDKKDTQR